MGSGGVAIAALPTVTCLKVPFSDGLGGEGGRHGVWRQSRTVDEVGGMLMISLVVMKGKGWGREGAISCFLRGRPGNGG